MRGMLPCILVLIMCSVARAAMPATTQGVNGPDVVVLKELVAMYEPVPFDHKSHAQMAEMWQGCVTCHHRAPAATTKPVAALNGHAKTQADAAAVPACKSCHEIAGSEANLLMPNLKGAYHRQCLNCHRDWAHANACGVCHKPRDASVAIATMPTTAPSVDDIVGRMHPPIPAPKDVLYVARFTPAVGSKVLFRHEEHVENFGMKCSSCHHRDNCATCHSAGASAATVPVAKRPVHPGRTWKDSHGPCVSCHQTDSCRHCHFDGEPAKAPKAFAHDITGQALDRDHVPLKCGQCHAMYKSKKDLTCGGSACHADRQMRFPADLPGAKVTTKPAVVQVVAIAWDPLESTCRHASLSIL